MYFKDAHLLITEPPTPNTIEEIKSSNYHCSHLALLKLAAKTEDDENHDSLLSLSCAVYGWMPTILKVWDFKNFNVDNPITTIRRLNNVKAALIFLSRIENISPLNNSWVGLSKLLYFLNPKIFPIWDSRIANNFGLNWPHQFNNKKAYISYFQFMHNTLAEKPTNIDVISQLIMTEHNYKPSNIRCLELLLFVPAR
ncbi:MAG: hypothetical protein OIF58_00315 [Cohaesibacter sp.]|nr:hypothetical protein [Cohaesibacter sp.]